MSTRVTVDIAPEPDGGWRGRAACRDYDPEIWFPIGDADPTLAVSICQDQCPVRDQCKTWAYEHAITDGVWGGETEEQRRTRLAGRPDRARLHRCEHCQKVYTAKRPEQRYCGIWCRNLAAAKVTIGGTHGPGCGTPGGARRHRKHGEPVDPLCRYAEALYRAQCRDRKKQEVPA